MIRILFFAGLRERLHTAELELPADHIATAGDIITDLSQRGPAWAEAFSGGAPVMVAINQTMARPASKVVDGDEVAFFPPVTGG
ncbi:molybdopterin converting factor subunit 1 [Mangrovitalea sediminis]|uniref:molybdopterin converting factor subunit 1 n=1 Tax=Mangrovitalea sediminis TaxID=1982043 RepID=UPI000BE5A9EF|nr:molybdopterin converting factor subunit 1 [Mangrovitalea sediminis]